MTEHPFDFKLPQDRKPRLLLVDDLPLNIQALHQVFAADCQVLMATSGEQALALCARQPPDLILLDLMMPGMDGFEVCRRIKADPALADIPVIFLTADQDEATEERGLECGAVDFVTKPFRPSVMRSRVKTHLTLKFQTDLLRQQALIDGLTGLYNRRFFDKRAVGELQRAQRNGSGLALMLVDVDFFKRYNDHYGHLAGDDALRAVATALRSQLRRPGDLAFRYGGEEFAVLLAETTLDGARVVAQALEAAVRQLAMPHAQSEVAPVLTVSIGGVCGAAPQDLPLTDWMRQADQQLYLSKARGRAQALIEPLAVPTTAAPDS
ncbi:diguanylate cyclase domain-containing protein [Roseateles sp. DB2]|uniref:diguanylate cyclase domain-containing protein n=1 Tax=Roseateles sp. DB2 TaxID=3453717 RepID=UPI003EE83173